MGLGRDENGKEGFGGVWKGMRIEREGFGGVGKR